MGKILILFSQKMIKRMVSRNGNCKALKDGKAADNRWHIRKDGSKFYAYGQVYP
jgi:two-component system CheB/CheR fusion protein